MTPPPLSRDDLEAVARFLEQRNAAKRPVVPASSRRGLVEEEIVPPHVRREISEAEYRSEERSKGFERLILDAIASQREEASADSAEVQSRLTKLAASIPPAAIAAKGAEDAAVVGAKASIAGASAAIDSKTTALAAKVATHRSIIVQLITAVALAAWQIYEHVK